MMSMSSWMYTHSFTGEPSHSPIGIGLLRKRTGAGVLADAVELFHQRGRERYPPGESRGTTLVLELTRHHHGRDTLGCFGRVDVADQPVDVGPEVVQRHVMLDIERDEHVAAR